MNQLYRDALYKADEVRKNLGLNMFQPLNVYDTCRDLELSVRFVDINMEGMYISQLNGKSSILLGNQRPFPRRSFTCAHELGHHLFGHGSKIDTITESSNQASGFDPDEYLVDSFAGALLMPAAGIQAEFAKRKWLVKDATPLQFYTICSVFGTGYQTLVTHCKKNNIINASKAQSLQKQTPGKILETIVGKDKNKSHFKILDTLSKLNVVDIEVYNYIFLPSTVRIEGDHLEKFQETQVGSGYLAKKPGIIRVEDKLSSRSFFVRIQNTNYIGLAEFRHLEN